MQNEENTNTTLINRDHRYRICDEATGKVLLTGQNEKELRREMLKLQSKYRFLKLEKDGTTTLYSIGKIN